MTRAPGRWWWWGVVLARWGGAASGLLGGAAAPRSSAAHQLVWVDPALLALAAEALDVLLHERLVLGEALRFVGHLF